MQHNSISASDSFLGVPVTDNPPPHEYSTQLAHLGLPGIWSNLGDEGRKRLEKLGLGTEFGMDSCRWIWRMICAWKLSFVRCFICPSFPSWFLSEFDFELGQHLLPLYLYPLFHKPRSCGYFSLLVDMIFDIYSLRTEWRSHHGNGLWDWNVQDFSFPGSIVGNP